MTDTPITREAVEARAALLRSDYAADGAAFDADMLLALLARAEKGEEMAQFYKDAFRKMEADFRVVCVERDEAERCSEAHGKERVFWKDKAEAAERERDEAREYAKEAWLREKKAEERRVHATNYLTADLVAARKTIDGMREALEPFGAGASLMEADSDDRVVSIGRWHDTDYPRFIADIRVSVADIRRARAALAQANKTEEE